MLAEISTMAMIQIVGLGTTIKHRREALDMQQGEFAEMVGVKQSSASAWESEQTLPRTEKLPRIAAALRCSVEDLIEGVNATYDRDHRKKIKGVTSPDTGTVRQSSPSTTQPVAGGPIDARARLSSHDTLVRELGHHERAFERTIHAIIKHARDIARLSDALDGTADKPAKTGRDPAHHPHGGGDVRQAGGGKRGARR